MFNGHKNWNHWNVSLWIGNDEGLYARACDAIRECHTKDRAAHYLLTELRKAELTATPDGAPYTYTTIRAALRGLE